MMEENNSLCCLFLGIFYAIMSSFIYAGVRLWNKFSERYENEEEPPKKVIRKKPVLSKKVKKIRRNVKNKKPKPRRKVPASSTEASEDENYKAPSRSPSKSKNFHPDKKKTIKSIEIEKNITKGTPDGKGEEAKTDVDTILYVEKHPISDKLDIDLDVVIDKESKKPMTVNVEAQLDNEKATVSGQAKGKEKGKAMIDTEVHHSDYYEHHHDKARDRNILDLNIEKKDKAAKDMELDARENTPIQVSNAEANKEAAKFKKKKPSRSESADSKASKTSRSSSKSKKSKPDKKPSRSGSVNSKGSRTLRSSSKSKISKPDQKKQSRSESVNSKGSKTSRSSSKSKNFKPDKKKTIKSVSIKENVTKKK